MEVVKLVNAKRQELLDAYKKLEKQTRWTAKKIIVDIDGLITQSKGEIYPMLYLDEGSATYYSVEQQSSVMIQEPINATLVVL